MLEEYTSASFILLNDIDLASFTNLTQSFINATFMGNLSGQGFTIRNLMIEGPGDNNTLGRNLALFRKLQNAEIQNIILENFNITGTGYIGALSVEFTQNITLSNINISGGSIRTDVIDPSTHYQPTGALASIVRDANIFAQYINNSLGIYFMRNENGGLFGDLAASNLILNNITQSGVVSGPGTSVRVGGIIGLVEINSRITMSGITITGNINGNRDVGGLFGLFKGISISGTDIQLIGSKVRAFNTNNGHLIGNLNSAGQVKFENVNVTNGENIKLIGTTGLTLYYSTGDDTSKTTFSNASIDN
jgi:hypothetical protein